MAALILGIGAFIACKVVIPPTYTATTRVYVLNQSSGNNISYTDFQSASQMAKDYEVLITGKNVTSEVIRELSLQLTDTQLAKTVSVSVVNDSRIVEISVKNTDPVLAAQIANSIRQVASEQIVRITEVDAVNLIYEASVPESPSSPHVAKSVLLATILGFFGAMIMLFIAFVADDTIKNEDDVERYLQLSTIGVIPDIKQTQKNSNRNGGHHHA